MEQPGTGDAVAINLRAGRQIPTSVVAVHGSVLELNLPSVLAPGATLKLVWAGRQGAVGADASVVARPGAGGLCVELGAISAAERRTLLRARPDRALAVTANPVARPGQRERLTMRGALHDISLGGLAFLTTGSVHLGDTVMITLGQPMAEPLLTNVAARVVHLTDRPDGRRLVSCAFDDPRSVGDVVSRLVAA